MKEILFLIGFCFALGSVICLIVKTLSKTVDPNERLSDKMPPYWFYAVTSAIAGVCSIVSYFCF